MKSVKGRAFGEISVAGCRLPVMRGYPGGFCPPLWERAKTCRDLWNLEVRIQNVELGIASLTVVEKKL